ncbi:hypothetical protein LJC01_00940 [Clostridiaceae bacterium OttesenSCG-928-D20]|nr:hypothetical protein [Clostridiaceae bacterium OttesenSCG-928-D20]
MLRNILVIVICVAVIITFVALVVVQYRDEFKAPQSPGSSISNGAPDDGTSPRPNEDVSNALPSSFNDSYAYIAIALLIIFGLTVFISKTR